ncbi:hypothetical protein [Aquimarina sp. I32.4]|uniref:hypothetical protein n=1 Tax=Aquimarina sp. I32.4 TaxID=2053903 RepID=UPI000CDED1FA|nr:hypothetical protein [Aquimarina sp. I32.4]
MIRNNLVSKLNNEKAKAKKTLVRFLFLFLLIGFVSCETGENLEVLEQSDNGEIPSKTSVNICVKLSTLLSDTSGTENYFTSSRLTNRSYVNGRVRVKRKSDNATIQTRYTDSNGCVSLNKPSQTSKYYIEITPVLKLDRNSFVYAYTGSRSTSSTKRITRDFPSSGGLTIKETKYDATFNVMSTLGYIINRTGSFNAHRNLHVIINTNHSSGSHMRRSGSHLELHIYSGHRNSRYVMAHEFGHVYQYFFDTDFANDCSYQSSSCRGIGNHSMRSSEYSSCGTSEGFAHFFALRSWHNQSNSSAKFKYYKGSKDVIPVYSGTSEYPLKYRIAECTVSSNSDKYTELDFMRTFATMHKRGSSLQAITQWIGNSNFKRDTAFKKLNDEANQIGGSLRNNWQDAYLQMLR